MFKIKMKDLIFYICLLFTAVNVLNIFFSFSHGDIEVAIRDINELFLCTLGILSIHIFTSKLFDSINYRLVQLIHYVSTGTIAMLYVYVSGFFTELHPDAYKDMYVSYTILYIIVIAIFEQKEKRRINKINLQLQNIHEGEN